MKKLISLMLVAVVAVSAMFAGTYEELLAKAKSYEAKKEWAYALGYYYDAAFAENAQEEALERFEALSSSIEGGNPGLGNFSVFEKFDKWKQLLMNAEKYATEYGRYEFDTSVLQQKSLDYKTRTATYSAKIKIRESDRYKSIIGAVMEGYKVAWNKDWDGLPTPEYWPMISVSGLSSKANMVNGVAVYRTSIVEKGYMESDLDFLIASAYSGRKPSQKVNIMECATGTKSATAVYNAFCCERAGGAEFPYNGAKGFFTSTLYDLKFNIVDNNGKEIVPPKRELLTTGLGFFTWNKDLGIYHEVLVPSDTCNIEFTGISESVMKKIDSGEARLNLLNVYLEYGVYNKADDTVATTGKIRAFIKSFPEVEIARNKVNFGFSDKKIAEIRKQKEAEAEQKRLEEEKKLEEQRLIEARRLEEERQKEIERMKIAVSKHIDSYIASQKELFSRLGFAITEEENAIAIQVTDKKAVGYKAGIRNKSTLASKVTFITPEKLSEQLFEEYGRTLKENEITKDFVESKIKQVLQFSSDNVPIGKKDDTIFFMGLEENKNITFKVNAPANAGDVAASVALSILFRSPAVVSSAGEKDITLTVPTAEEALAAQSATSEEDDDSEESDEKQTTKKKRKDRETAKKNKRDVVETSEKENRDETKTSGRKNSNEVASADKKNLGVDMVKIPGKNFEMLKTEVTQELYESVMGENPSNFQLGNKELKTKEKEALQKNCGNDTSKLPVENMSWYDAIVFCNKLSVTNGYKPVYSVNGTTDTSAWNYTPHNGKAIKGEIVQDKNANGFRLPTEAEWEYAALGGQKYKYAGSYDLDAVGWYVGNSDAVPHPVAKKKANGYGLYDMSGNVWECVWDSSPGNSLNRIDYGGGHFSRSECCEVSYRISRSADGQLSIIGFRVVRTAEQ